MSPFSRSNLIRQLADTESWDVLIIGGGATGLGVAVDAATRGYKTLLAEQSDFAKGTSSRSTKLVHGGVRYLAQGNIRLVKEALRERGLLLKNAPHLTRNEVIIIPCYSWFKGLFYAFGLKLYDWLSGRLSLGSSKLINRKTVVTRLPTINQRGLKCGVLYHDGTFDDARLAINLAQTAIDHGATVLNYVGVISLFKDRAGAVSGATLRDEESGKTFDIKARTIVNATGVFADDILRLDEPGAPAMIKPSQGVHLVFDQKFLKSADGIMIPHTDDGRVLFALPWHEKVLVGTTDTPLRSHALEPRALDTEVDFILENASRYLENKPGRKDVLSVFAGLRPLAATTHDTDKTKEISRSHKVVVSDSKLISVIGGKWTTYRQMAEDTLSKAISEHLLEGRQCQTQHLKIHGAGDSSNTELSIYGTDESEIRALIHERPE